MSFSKKPLRPVPFIKLSLLPRFWYNDSVMKKKSKILIIEDEQPLAKALELKLQSSGFEPSIAPNGEKALSRMERETFHVILLDLVMPKMDGFQFLEALKVKNKKPVIIVLSNLAQDEDISRVKRLGVKEYFVKSDTSLSEIIDTITSL